MHKYWQEGDYTLLKQARTYVHLREIAFLVLERMPSPIGEVCGPISTGGKGSIKANLLEFERVIEGLTVQGKIIFNQMPFQEAMQQLRIVSTPQANLELLETFYLPLFSSKKINTLYFLPDWQSSHGASWEHAQGKRLDLEIIYL